MVLLKDLNPVWDLDSIFPGGSSSKELEAHLRKVAADVEALPGLFPPAMIRASGRSFSPVQDVAARLRQAGFHRLPQCPKYQGQSG